MGKDGEDLFRDTPVRYMGYANEVGEAFRPLIPNIVVKLSYGLATGYVFADTFDKGSKVYKKTNGNIRATGIEGCDVLLWQMLASVIIPGYTINRVTWAADKILRYLGIRGRYTRFVPTIVGLSCIPFIVKPIDQTVDLVMDRSFRKYVK